jgi:signal transduction histidine kinase
MLGALVALTLGTYDAAANLIDTVPRFGTTSHGIMFLILSLNYSLLGRFARIDRALTERTEALARSVARLQAAQRNLVRTKQLAAVGELSAVIAHELKNPLAIIKNATSSLRKVEQKSEQGATLLTILDEEADHLNRLVVDLLAYAQPVTASEDRVDIGKLIEKSVEAVFAGRPRLSAMVERDTRIELRSPELQGDASLLHHALVNIVDNAVQAMPDGGSLRIRCRPIERGGRSFVAIEVRDTGKGMDASIRERALDPFFTTRETGTGLGLAIVERIAKAHRGRLKIDSRAGRGTNVRLLLPRSLTSA